MVHKLGFCILYIISILLKLEQDTINAVQGSNQCVGYAMKLHKEICTVIVSS